MGALTIWSAGAGSGKTFRLCEEICRRIADDGLDPARLLATTFTTAAAAELQGRVAGRLLAEAKLSPERRVALAERLDLALIGTVHAVGHRLVRRHAFALGLSPNLEVADEEATTRHLERLLGELEPGPWERLGEIAARLSIEKPHEEALALLKSQRANAIGDAALTSQVAASVERLVALLAPSGPPLPGGLDGLVAEARAALAAIEPLGDTTKVTASAVTKLQRIARTEAPTWADVASVAELEAGRKSGANDLLEPLRRFGADVRRRQALHDDLRQWGALLAGQTVELGRRWARYKSERGLVDFVDLETLLLDLLNRPDLEEELRRSLALVVVDEFQDTNPIQLAIFLRLRELAAESLWVGDGKQAIYGFRGSDAELVEKAGRSVADARHETLEKNWRSVAPIVHLTGELFSGVLGEEARLVPVREGAPSAVERWILNPSETKGKREREIAALAVGIADLVDSGVRPRDIAVLIRTRKWIEEVGATLQELGLPVALAVPGLLAMREVRAAVAGLRLVADRSDGVAAATLLHLLGPQGEELPGWLPDRLLRLRDAAATESHDEWNRPWSGHPLLAPLEEIPDRTLDPAGVVRAVVEALSLRDRLAAWGDPERRGGHLDALLALATAYQAEARESGLGATVAGFIGHVETLAADGEDEIPAPLGLDAITVATYHGAKGCEWPVVVLGQLEHDRDPDLWKPDVTGGAAEAGRPLDDRRLRLWSWPFGRGLYGQPSSGAGLRDDALASPEGVAAQQAADAEALRLLYVGVTRARDRVILAHRPSPQGWIGLLPSLDAVLDPALGPGSHPLPKLGTELLVRHLDHAQFDARRRRRPDRERWMTAAAPTTPSLSPRWRTPSHAPAAAPAPPAPFQVDRLPGAAALSHRVTSVDEAARLGNALHAYLGALPSLAPLDAAARAAVARRCLAGWNVGHAASADDLVAIGNRLSAWVASRWPDASVLTEVPMEAPASPGGWWRGTADLLLLLPDGRAVVVDHKTVGFDASKPDAALVEYSGQLAAYREAFGGAGVEVAETWIHFAFDGVAVGG